MTNPTTLCILVEDQERPQKERLVAGAQLAFVTDAFVRWIRSGAPPWVIGHATRPLPDGSWPLLDPQGVRQANSGDGLNALLTRFNLSDGLISLQEEYASREYLNRGFGVFYRGYRFKDILVEVTGKSMVPIVTTIGFRLLNDYAAFYQENPPEPPPETHPYLMGITRDEALVEGGSIASHFFVYVPPRFFFKPHEQDLLLRALRGESDDRIAQALDVSNGAIKKRWLAIYERVADIDPQLLPQGASEGARGAEKRRVLLRYLQDHLEELRPLLPPGE